MTVALSTARGLVLVEDDKADRALAEEARANATARRARPADVPVRDDLPTGHPLRGKRALRVVPAGMPDCTVDADGRLVPIDPKTGEAVAIEAAEGRHA